MRILVIEDKKMHQASARETLKGHDLTIVSSLRKALEILANKERPFEFDVVLTDMNLPMENDGVWTGGLAEDVFNPNEQVPYGFVLALLAARRGARFVAMVTDTNHHKSAMSAALDLLAPSYWGNGEIEEMIQLPRIARFMINGASVIFVHTPFVKEVTKDMPCNRCTENPGTCSNCNGTGFNKNPNWQPRECHSCGHTDTIGKCTQCKGTARYDRTDTLETKDWGRVLKHLIAEPVESLATESPKS